MGQGIDGNVAPNIFNRLDAGQGIGAINIHSTAAANPFPAGPAKG
jgi:hypothetical protein